MIFNSPEMESLRKKYLGIPTYEVPEIVFLDYCDEYKNECTLLENVITLVSPQKQKDWFGRLVNCEVNQHIGSWFEMMLFNWLKEDFQVQVEPEIKGCFPDFVIDRDGSSVIIEATAYLVPSEERLRHQNLNRIYSFLHEIRMSFNAHLSIHKLGLSIQRETLVSAVTKWLDSIDNQPLIYNDEFGNEFELKDKMKSNHGHLCIWSFSGISVNPEVLKPALKGKASQHKAIRRAGYPYVIALFLEPHELSGREVVSAWLGKTQVIVDRNGGGIIETRTDGTGLHYFKNQVFHKSISGTLVFNAKLNPEKKTRELESSYIQNPYAEVPLPPTYFPVQSRFMVVGKTDSKYEMDWV